MTATIESILGQLRFCDCISIVGLEVYTCHGVFDFEKVEPQPFIIDAELYLDTRMAGKSDQLSETANYGLAVDIIKQIVNGKPVNLVENLAQKCADKLLELGAVIVVHITIHKPDAPVSGRVSDVNLSVWRGLGELDVLLPTMPEAETLRKGPIPLNPGTQARVISHLGKREDAEREALRSVPSKPVSAVLALGANLGNPADTFKRVIRDLKRIEGIGVKEISPLVRSRPVLMPGQASQPDYYNVVLLVQTHLSPQELLVETQNLEDKYGRVRNERWGPRTLDIDIIDYYGMRSSLPELTLPHPRVHQRAFVLLPWSLVDPRAHLAGYGDVMVLANYAPDRDGIVEINAHWQSDPVSFEVDKTGEIPLPHWDSLINSTHEIRIVDLFDNDEERGSENNQSPAFSTVTAEEDEKAEKQLANEKVVESIPQEYSDASVFVVEQGGDKANQITEDNREKKHPGLLRRLSQFFKGAKARKDNDDIEYMLQDMESREDLWNDIIEQTYAEEVSDSEVLESDSAKKLVHWKELNSFEKSRHAGELSTGEIPIVKQNTPLPPEITEDNLFNAESKPLEYDAIYRPTNTGPIPLIAELPEQKAGAENDKA